MTKHASVTCSLMLAMALIVASASAAHTLQVRGNRVVLDRQRGVVLYRSSGDLNSDGRFETAFLVFIYDGSFGGILVARPVRRGWNLMAMEETGRWDARADVTDTNGDGKLEIVMRAMSGDGHRYCRIYRLIGNHLVMIADFHDTRFRDLDHDGIPEVLSIEAVSFMFVGDHWLTIYKWNGKGYTDVSRRFPREYEAVIRDLKKTIYQMRYTRAYGQRSDPKSDPDIFADLYYYLGLAYEYRGLPDQAKAQYAIAYRLDPSEPRNANAFRRTWRKHSP